LGNKIGKVITITGPMFSGKTSRLIELLERHMRAGRKVALFKPNIDFRYSENEVTSHNGIKMNAIRSPIGLDSRDSIKGKIKGINIIGFDEVQFWKESSHIDDFIEDLAFSGKTIYCSALNRDHFGKPFAITKKILGISDEIYSLTAVCSKCGEDATFTQRINDGKPYFGAIIKIGGKGLYEPRCRNCYVKPTRIIHF